MEMHQNEIKREINLSTINHLILHRCSSKTWKSRSHLAQSRYCGEEG